MKMMERIIHDLEDVGLVELMPKLMGKMLSLVLAPTGKKKKVSEHTTEPAIA
jgi:translation initiation factor IF-3